MESSSTAFQERIARDYWIRLRQHLPFALLGDAHSCDSVEQSLRVSDSAHHAQPGKVR